MTQLLLRVVCKPLMAVIPQANMIQKIIDPHVHFFDLAKGEYSWLLPDNPPYWPDKSLINKDSMPHHLVLNNNYFLQGAVHIEAGFDNINPKREVDWLASQVYPQAQKTQFRTIAFINIFEQYDVFKKQLFSMLDSPNLAGFRCIIDDDACFFKENSLIKQNLFCVAKTHLIFELHADFTKNMLIANLHNMLVSLPDLKIVINHAGLPPLAESEAFGHWQANMEMFAALPNCYVKCSGFEMTNREYTKEHVCDVMSAIAELYGYDRMMLASNFPLTLFTRSYCEYWNLMFDCVKETHLPIKKVLCTNAKDLYGFS